MRNFYSVRFLKFFFLSIIVSIALSSCKKNDTASPQVVLTVSKANYSWGELAINKKIESDVIKYNANGSIDNVITYDASGQIIRNITFSYKVDTITLNTLFKDKYQVDAAGRIVFHSTEEIQNGHDIVSIERFAYDAAGYLNKVTMSSNFDSYVGPVYSTINYVVKNGNYTKFALSNSDDGTVTRQYNFSYNTAKKVNSPCSFFSPIFANNTNSNIDKYLNYGRASANLLTGVSYYLTNSDKTVSTGSFNAVTEVNSDNYVTSLKLTGNTITSFPSDNISPLPRSVSFDLTK
jgi:hypothetical protein